MKKYQLSFGRSIGFKHEAPERTAKRVGARLGDQDTFQVWPNRESMARSIRMQQSRAPKQSDWRPLVPLQDWEGFGRMPAGPQRATDAEIREELRNEVTNQGDC